MFLLPVSGDLAGDPRLEALPRRRQADAPHRVTLLGTPLTPGLQLQQGCKTSSRELTVSTSVTRPRLTKTRRPLLTYVVFKVPLTVVVRFVDDDFLHPESLLSGRVALVQSVFTQDDGEAVGFGVGAET